MTAKEEIEAFLQKEIDEALEPYRAMGLSEEVLADMAATLHLALTTHPRAIELVQEVRPRVVEESGSMPVSETSAAKSKAGNRS